MNICLSCLNSIDVLSVYWLESVIVTIIIMYGAGGVLCVFFFVCLVILVKRF